MKGTREPHFPDGYVGKLTHRWEDKGAIGVLVRNGQLAVDDTVSIRWDAPVDDIPGDYRPVNITATVVRLEVDRDPIGLVTAGTECGVQLSIGGVKRFPNSGAKVFLASPAAQRQELPPSVRQTSSYFVGTPGITPRRGRVDPSRGHASDNSEWVDDPPVIVD